MSQTLRAFALFAITIILFVKIVQTKILNLDFLVLILVLYIFSGSVVGYINNGVSYEFVRHLFAAATMLVSYWAGRFFSFEGPWITSTLRWWAWISVAAGVLAWVMTYRMIDYVAFSMSPVSQILPFSVGLTTGSVFLVVLALLLIAFGNKRDVILGAAAIFVVMVVRRYLAKLNAGLRIAAGAMLTVVFVLVIFLAVTTATQLLAKLSAPLPTNLAERSNRVLDFVYEEVRRDGKTVYWRLENLTSSRMSLSYSVYKSVTDANFGLLLGKGFGASYEWTYWSNNLDAWQTIVLYQCDLMPLWFLLTSGIFVSILLVGGIGWRIFQIFIYSTENKVQVAALLVIGSSFGMLLSFQPNVPLFWLFLGSMAARIQSSRSS